MELHAGHRMLAKGCQELLSSRQVLCHFPSITSHGIADRARIDDVCGHFWC